MTATRFAWLLLALVALSFALTPARCAHILALFTSTQRSHHLVYAAVVEALLTRQHQVTVITVLPFDELQPHLNLRQIQLQPSIQPLESRATNELEKLQRMLQRIETSSAALEDPAFTRFMLDERSTKFDLLLLGYLFNDYQLGVAAHFDCPVALIWTGQPVGFVHSLMGNPEERRYVTQAYDRHQSTGLSALVFGLFEKMVEWMALQRMQSIYDKYFPAPHYASLEQLRKNVSMVLCNHHSLSEGPIAPHVPSIVEVGGIQRTAQLEVLPESLQHIFANDQRNVIFVSLGTRVKWSALPAKILTHFVETFRQLATDYNIIWTYDGDCAQLTSNASNIICDRWFPQNAILAQPNTKLFVTHGGKGSITEALHHGVPLLGLPIFGDQRANIERLTLKQCCGLRLDWRTLTQEQLYEAIIALTHNATFAANAKYLSARYRDRPMTARDSAIYWLEYVMRHKGASHMRSPLLQLNGAQYYLMDIYAVLLGSFVGCIWICNWLERKLA